MAVICRHPECPLPVPENPVHQRLLLCAHHGAFGCLAECLLCGENWPEHGPGGHGCALYLQADPPPDMLLCDVEEAHYTQDTGLTVVLNAPSLVVLAAEAAALLDQYNCANYLELELKPRAESGNRRILLLLRWAEGETPGKRVKRLERELAALQTRYDSLVAGL